MNSPTDAGALAALGRLVLELGHPAGLAEAGQALQHPRRAGRAPGTCDCTKIADRSGSMPIASSWAAARRIRSRSSLGSCSTVIACRSAMKKNGSWSSCRSTHCRSAPEVVAEVERVGGRLDPGEHPRPGGRGGRAGGRCCVGHVGHSSSQDRVEANGRAASDARRVARACLRTSRAPVTWSGRSSDRPSGRSAVRPSGWASGWRPAGRPAGRAAAPAAPPRW